MEELMKFYDLKHKFRRAVLTGIVMLSSMMSCKSSVPPKEQVSGNQNSEWAETNLEKPPIHGERRDLYKEASWPDNGTVQTRLSPPEQGKDLTRINRVTGIFNEQVIDLSFHRINLTGALPEISFLNKQTSTSFLQNPNPPCPSIRNDWFKLPPAHGGKWKIRGYASHAFTHYFPSDIRIKTSRYDVTIHDYEWVERGSREYFNPKTWFSSLENSPIRMFDEPSNGYTLAFEKNAHVIFISQFHPKFYQDPDQARHIQGAIDWVAVDHVAPVNADLNGSYQLPGAMRLEENKNTRLQMEFEAGYGYKFNLASSKKFGKIFYVPGISAGVQTGKTASSAIKDGELQEYDEKYSIQGVGGSIRNKIEWRTPKERFGIFYENKTALYRRKHELLDGTQRFNFCYMASSAGFSFTLYNSARHSKPVSGSKFKSYNR